MSGLGYRLPGTIIEDQTKPASFNVSSSQRKPCFIGLASPYKKVTYEEVSRGSTEFDELMYTSSGIYQVNKMGSQKGLNNFKEGIHFDIEDDKIKWLPKIVDSEIATIEKILTPINYNTSIEAGVDGVDATSGYALISSSPTAFIGGVEHKLRTGTYTLRVAVDDVIYTSFDIGVTSGETWNDLITDLNSAITGATATLTSGMIKITSDTTGSSSIIAVKDGVTSGLLEEINLVGTYITTIETPVDGVDATNGSVEVEFSNTIIDEYVSVDLGAATYKLNIDIDGGGAGDLDVVISSASNTWGDIRDAINTVSGIDCVIQDGKFLISSSTTGTTSTIALLDGSVDGLLLAIETELTETVTIGTPVGGADATYGYAELSSDPTDFVGTVPCRISAGSYNIQVGVNNNAVLTYEVTFDGTETWTQAVTKIDDAINSVDVSISSGNIRLTSKITGDSSNVMFEDGESFGLIQAISDIAGSYTTSFEVSVAGVEAISGYAFVNSFPDTFDPTVYCNIASGMYNLGVNIDGGGATDFPVVISGVNQTWLEVIASLNDNLVGATAIIENNGIKVTSNSTGITSTIAITDGSSNGILTAINNLVDNKITVQTSALKYRRVFSEADVVLTVGATDYHMTVAEDITEDDTELTLYADYSVLENIVNGAIIGVRSVGSWLVEGATYYVSYDYNRPDEDYKYKEFYDFNDVLADLGDDIPDNDLVMISKLALNLYNVPLIGVYQIKSKTKTNFLNALNDDTNGIKYKNIQTVFCLTTDEDVRSYVVNHVTERSLPESGRYRMTYIGASSGTPVGDDDTPDSLRGICSAINNERAHFVNATRGLYFYNDPDTGEERSTIVEGDFISAAIGSYRDAFPSPVTTLLNRTVAGITLFDEDEKDYYSEFQLTRCGSSSMFLVAPSAAGGMVVIDDLTTDNSTVERNNTNIITAKDYIATDVSIQMDRVFKGQLIYDEAEYVGNVNSFLTKLFAEYKRNRIIAQVGYVQAQRHATNKNTILIAYGYYAVYTHKYTEGTFEILV